MCVSVCVWHLKTLCVGFECDVFFLLLLWSPPYWRRSLRSICKYSTASFFFVQVPNTSEFTHSWYVLNAGRSSMKPTQISKRKGRSLMTWSPKWTATVSQSSLSTSWCPHPLLSFTRRLFSPSQWQRRLTNSRRSCGRRMRTWSRWRSDTSAMWRRRERSVHLTEHVVLSIWLKHKSVRVIFITG